MGFNISVFAFVPLKVKVSLVRFEPLSVEPNLRRKLLGVVRLSVQLLASVYV